MSAFYRHEGGWIDSVNGNYTITDPTGASYGNSVNFTQTSTIAKNVNWNQTAALRAALKWTPTESLTITPAVFYQEHHLNDGAGNVYDLATSHGGKYSRQGFVAYPAGTVYNVNNPVEQLTLNAEDVPQNAFGNDRFTLSSIGISWDLGRCSWCPTPRTSTAPPFSGTTTPRATWNSTYRNSSSPPTG